MNTAQDYFFTTPLFPQITDDVLHARVGVNNSNPQTDFDVNGTIRSTNYTGSNVYVSTATAGTVDANIVLADTISACNVVATIGAFGQVEASNVYGSNIYAYDDMGMFGQSFSNPCPFQQTALDTFLGMDVTYAGWIHNSWIYYPVTMAKTMEDIASLASDGLLIADLLSKLAALVNPLPTIDPITPALAQALEQALSDLGNSNASGSNKIPVSWGNLTGKPLANYGTKIGVNGDICLGGNVNMVSAAGTFQPDHWANTTFISGGSAMGTTVIDSNYNFYSQNVNSSNLICNYYTGTSCNAALQFQNNTASAQLSVLNKNGSNNTPSSWTSGIMRLTDSNLSVLQQVGFGAYNEVFKVNVDGVFAPSFVSPSNDASLYFTRQGQAQLSTLNKVNPNDPSTWLTGMMVVSSSNTNFVSQTGFGQYLSNAGIDTSGSLYVRSNVAMVGTAIIRSTGNTNYNLGYPVATEGVLQFSDTAFRYIQRASNVSLSNALSNVVDTIAFSVNSNGVFLLSSPSIYGAYETILTPNPVNPLSNLASSNFARIQFDLQNGFRLGTGLSNDNFLNLDYFSVDRYGQMFVKDYTTNLSEQITTSNASLVRGKSEIKKTGEYYFNGKVLVDSNGTFTRSNFTVSSNGVVSFGSNTVLTDGQLYCASNYTLSNASTAMTFNQSGFTLCNLRIDIQGGVSVGQTYLSPSGGIDINQQVVMTSGGALYPTYLQIGPLKIYQDGSIWNGNRELFDAAGNLNASVINWQEGGVIAAPSYIPPQNVYQGSPLDY